uniref:TF-B3 domain-containing protein n=2 Tax=Brassica oleracea var. oleracea TaxID=109376 RepID=A0A0D3DQY2_BRAOL
MDGRDFGLVMRKTLVILDRSRKKKSQRRKAIALSTKRRRIPRQQTAIPAANDGDLSPSTEQGFQKELGINSILILFTFVSCLQMANPHEPHFFKPLLPGFQSGVTIPLAFFSKHIEGKTNQKTWKLRSDASDQTWEVIQEDRTLTRGWKDFTTAHDLQIGDLVIFKHEGDMVFHVTPFGPSCCEIQYTHPHIIKEEADAGDADDNEISKS